MKLALLNFLILKRGQYFKSVIREMINLNIVELEKNDFNSFTEKLTYGRLIRELGKSKEEKWKETDL